MHTSIPKDGRAMDSKPYQNANTNKLKFSVGILACVHYVTQDLNLEHIRFVWWGNQLSSVPLQSMTGIDW